MRRKCWLSKCACICALMMMWVACFCSICLINQSMHIAHIVLLGTQKCHYRPRRMQIPLLCLCNRLRAIVCSAHIYVLELAIQFISNASAVRWIIILNHLVMGMELNHFLISVRPLRCRHAKGSCKCKYLLQLADLGRRKNRPSSFLIVLISERLHHLIIINAFQMKFK